MTKYVAMLLFALGQGCSEPRTDEGSTSLIRGSWILRQLEGRHIGHSSPEAATVRFLANHFIAGTAVCNDVGGDELTWSAEVSGHEGSFDQDRSAATITTAVGCLDYRAMQIGDRFWALMGDARGWSVKGNSLTISFSNGSKAVLVSMNRAGS